MPDGQSPHTATQWVGVWKNVISFVVGVVVASFVVGSARQKVQDLVKWKEDTAPRIERMDRSGTTSFDLFHQEYLRTQQRQEEKLKELEKEIRQLERTAHQPN
jgi:hypothetical protein